LNTTFQRSIGTSPFQLMFGTKMRITEDVQLNELIDEEIKQRFEDSRYKLRSIARDQIKKTQEENRKTYNKKRKASTRYEVGDLVAIKRTQLGPGLKLKIKFLGPYKITEVRANDRYSISKIDGEGPQETLSSADNMKPWKGFSKDDFDDEDGTDEEDTDEASSGSDE